MSELKTPIRAAQGELNQSVILRTLLNSDGIAILDCRHEHTDEIIKRINGYEALERKAYRKDHLAQSLQHHNDVLICEKKKLEQRLTAIKDELDRGFDSENLEYDLQAVNWVHKSVSGELPKGEGM